MRSNLKFSKETGCQCLWRHNLFEVAFWISKQPRFHNYFYQTMQSSTELLKYPEKRLGIEYLIKMRFCKLFGPFWKFWAAYWAHLLASRTDKTRHDGDMLNYRKLAFANELQFEMGNCFLDRLAYNQAIECIKQICMSFQNLKKLMTNVLEIPTFQGCFH